MLVELIGIFALAVTVMMLLILTLRTIPTLRREVREQQDGIRTITPHSDRLIVAYFCVGCIILTILFLGWQGVKGETSHEELILLNLLLDIFVVGVFIYCKQASPKDSKSKTIQYHPTDKS